LNVALICPVRDCGNELQREANSYVCVERHAFDIARNGYINLLQPQDRKSSEPGDSKEAVQARARFLARFGDPIVPPIAAAVRKSARKRPLLDIGCGVGYHLDRLRATLSSPSAWGVDLSSTAVDRAARDYQSDTFVVANADRTIPFADASFGAIFSITARRNRDELARLLGEDGRVVIVVPAADDLIELRELSQGEAVLRDRVASMIEEMLPLLEVVDSFTLKRSLELDRNAVDDILAATYRGARHSERQRLSSITGMRVTMSRDAVVFRKA
jgi:23S rRNA (guanine745-N1)-methyltransferase